MTEQQKRTQVIRIRLTAEELRYLSDRVEEKRTNLSVEVRERLFSDVGHDSPDFDIDHGG
jgi:hypothetical protein